MQLPSDLVTVSINHVKFHADAPIYGDDDIKKLFVEYRFLGVDPEETETEFALPKPPPDTPINFNFTKGELL